MHFYDPPIFLNFSEKQSKKKFRKICENSEITILFLRYFFSYGALITFKCLTNLQCEVFEQMSKFYFNRTAPQAVQ